MGKFEVHGLEGATLPGKRAENSTDWSQHQGHWRNDMRHGNELWGRYLAAALRKHWRMLGKPGPAEAHTPSVLGQPLPDPGRWPGTGLRQVVREVSGIGFGCGKADQLPDVQD